MKVPRTRHGPLQNLTYKDIFKNEKQAEKDVFKNEKQAEWIADRTQRPSLI